MNSIKYFFRILKDLIFGFTVSVREFYPDRTCTKIMSFNIRRDTPSDNNWTNRRSKIVDFIYNQCPDIICMQEVMPHMYKYLDTKLGLDYRSRFVDAFTGGSKGFILSEGLTIFVRNKFHILDSGHIRLHKGFGFETKYWRICQWVVLENNNEITYVFNTHLDHLSKEARREGIKKILAKIEELKQTERYLPTKSKFFICGDFNTQIQDEEMSELNKWSCNYVTDGTMVNRKRCIDYIFTQNVIPEYDCPQVIMSDHYPIICKVNYTNADKQ